MDVKMIADKLNMKVLAGKKGLGMKVEDIYACDLLSWVMARAEKASAWITIHSHVNIVAVALLAELSCIIVSEGVKVESNTLERADMEGIPVLGTTMKTHRTCIEIHNLIKREQKK